MTDLPSIPEFYRGKNIFITGGSGFIGKVLIEKLLRSCPDLQNLYLLMREKKGKTVEERIEAITNLPLFDRLKAQNPQSLAKIRLINGDVAQLDLGLTPQDKQMLIEKINIVFHGAASVRFDDSLTDAVFLNTRGTREVVNLALEMKNLEVLMHISTTYCHTDRKQIREELYPEHADWRKTIEIAEKVDRHTLNILTEKYIKPLPNTYTFTKSLAEHVVYDLCKGRIPAVIFRPSIVISTADEPMPGWIDNFNGPVGLLVACGKGIVRIVNSDPDVIADYIPVDILVKAMIMALWKQATNKNIQKLEPAFYNGSSYDVQSITMGQIVELGRKISGEVPFNDVLWHPDASTTKCYYYYFISMVVFHILPALFLDGVLRILRKKPKLLKIQRRIYVANTALAYFSNNQWEFVNDKAVALPKEILPCDLEDFNYNEDSVDPLEYFQMAALGSRRYLLKESDDTFENAKKHSRRMWVASKIVDVLWYSGLAWLVFVKIDIVSLLLEKYRAICDFYLSAD